MPDPAATPARHVLITRPEADQARTAGLIAARGFIPLAAPCLAVETRAVPMAPGIQAVLVASGNALPALTPAPIPLLAVGDATAARARAAGWTRVDSAGRDAEALAALAIGRLDPAAGPLLLPSAEGQGARLASALRAAGFTVRRRVAYRVRRAPALPPAALAAIAHGQVHAALFLSGETARAFRALLPAGMRPALANVMALAIGSPAADALKPLPWRAIRLARSPTLEDVLALL